MSVLKFRVRAALIALAMLVASPHAARAETTFLKCGQNTFAIDTTKQTVNGYPATVTPLAIDWERSNNVGDVQHHIDRTNGTYTSYGVYHSAHGDKPFPPDTYSCAKISAPATKF